MMTAQKSVGRLVLLTFREPLAVEDLTSFLPTVRSIVLSTRDRVVFCSDFRTVKSIPELVREQLVWLLNRDNAKVLRGAAIYSAGSIAVGEAIEAMLRQAKSESRLVFCDPVAVRQWLGPELTSEENAALDAFLGA